MPWLISLFRHSRLRPVCGVVEGNKLLLRNRKGEPYAPNFYAKCEPEYSGTRIEGHFDLAPLVKLSFRLSLVVILAIWFIGIVLNVLDLTAGTHFTKDPHFGLVLCVAFVPFTVAFYFVMHKLGTRPDKSLLAFLEETLATRTCRLTVETSPFNS